MSKWDTITKLSASQQASVDLFGQFNMNQHYFDEGEAASAKAGPASEAAHPTPTTFSHTTTTTTTTATNTNKSKSSAIATTSDFLAWFSSIEATIEFEHEQRYWAHLASLNAQLAACDRLLDVVAQAADEIDREKSYFEFVEGKTEALKKECESLLSNQMELETLSLEIQDRLIKFNVLEPAVRLFNGTGVDGVVLDVEFVPMLARLDDSLAFVEAHKQYRDADLYRMKFRQCITRGLTLIKMYFVDAMRLLGDGISRILHDRGSAANSSNPETALLAASSLPAVPQSLQQALLYAKFKSAAESSLRGLIAEIEARIPGHPEYYGLLGECLSAYFGIRSGLVKSGVDRAVDGFLAESQDVLEVAKKGAAYIMSLSADECTLFSSFFIRGETELIQYLDNLSVSLYDHLRPRIVREQRIDVLADLCRSLQLHLESVESLTTEGSGAPVKYVVGKILEDAQERLAFRAAEYIRSEIERFSPKERELDVLARSRKLPIPSAVAVQANMVPDLVPDLAGEEEDGEAAQQEQQETSALLPETSATSPGTESTPSVKSPPPRQGSTTSILSQDEQVAKTIHAGKLVYGSGEWYPTLHKALYILGKLYRAVPKPIFEDLAQEAIDLCRKSMIGAAEVIAAKNTRLDGQFFLIKNLLMLREQIAPFDSNFVRKEDVIDFSRISDALANVFKTKWGITTLPTLGLTFLTTQLPGLLVPRLVEHVSKDSKLSVNLSLKQTCEEMILDTVKACVEPVSSFMIKVTAFRLKAVKTPTSTDRLGMQAFASPQKCVECSNAFAASVQARIGGVVSKMGDYLGDKRTEAVLLLHIKGNLVESYTSFYAVVTGEHDRVVLEGLLSVEDVSALIDVCCAQNMRLNITLAIIGSYCYIDNLVWNDYGSLVSNFTLSREMGIKQLGLNGGFTYFYDLGVQMGLDYVNANESILPGFHFNVKRFSDCGAYYPAVESFNGNSGGYAQAVTAIDVVGSKDVIGAVGIEYSTLAKGLAEILSNSKIPYCTPASGSPSFTDRNDYPYFFRTFLTLGLGEHMYQLLKFWNVKRIAVIYQKDDYMGIQFAVDALNSMSRHSVAVVVKLPISTAMDEATFEYCKSQILLADARYLFVSGQNSWTNALYNGLGSRGIVGSKYVWFGINNLNSLAVNPKGFIYLTTPLPNMNSFIVKQAAEMYTSLSMLDSSILRFQDAMAQYGVGQAFDCVLLLALGFKKLLASNPTFTAEMLSNRSLQSYMNFTLFQNVGYDGISASPETLNQYGDLASPIEAFCANDDATLTGFGITDMEATSFSYHPNTLPTFNDAVWIAGLITMVAIVVPKAISIRADTKRINDEIRDLMKPKGGSNVFDRIKNATVSFIENAEPSRRRQSVSLNGDTEKDINSESSKPKVIAKGQTRISSIGRGQRKSTNTTAASPLLKLKSTKEATQAQAYQLVRH
ncbi:Golgi transport complex subunit 3 [Rhizoclosmatium sp. JEL0117]|nr:Golgi transport complex subunit 3 [Rhizoclosmatium sp. JEL0117]